MGKKRQNRSSRGSGSAGGGKSSSSTFSKQQQQPQQQQQPSTSRRRTTTTNITTFSNPPPSAKNIVQRFIDWCYAERDGLSWVLGCAILGAIVGFGIGTGYFTGATRIGGKSSSSTTNNNSSPWRVALGMKIRSTTVFQITTFQMFPWEPFLSSSSDDNGGTSVLSLFRATGKSSSSSSSSPSSASSGTSPMATMTTTTTTTSTSIWNRFRFSSQSYYSSGEWMTNPSHPYVFDILKEAIHREPGGYVHPDLGVLSPAPCGASRGLGMVSFSYTKCQSTCSPGIGSEKKNHHHNHNNPNNNSTQNNHRNQNPSKQPTTTISHYKQEEVLVRIPLTMQMTRQVALDTLLPLIPTEVQRRVPLEELDDATLLVLLLSHERGQGKASRFWPYLLSLPLEPSCGYSFSMRPYMIDSINMMGEQLGLDVNGWPAELAKATQYAERIAGGLARDYGSYLPTPESETPYQNFQWSLCQVASRGIQGSGGSLRLIPLMDMINHDANAGGFVELTGRESLMENDDDFVDASLDDAGTFVVRSRRHGRRKPLKKGQELLVNYNVPGYSPLDWFVSLGFVPPERWSQWTKVDAALPRVRTTPPPPKAGGSSSGGGGGDPQPQDHHHHSTHDHLL